LATEVRANEVRLSGQISEALHVALKLTLNSGNPLCWGGPLVVQADSKVVSGKYEIDANWSAGFCGYQTGLAEIAVSRDVNEMIKFDAPFGTVPVGSTEFHQIETLICGSDPDLNEFTCSAVRDDSSSVIGNSFYLDPDHSSADYHVDILAE
jgi:hypothetical protein